MSWLRILFAPGTFSRFVSDLLALAHLVKDHPDYGDQAIAVLESAQKFFPPAAESLSTNPPSSSL
jgi:hypothetical protein